VTRQANGCHRCTQRHTIRQTHAVSGASAWSTKDTSFVRFVISLLEQISSEDFGSKL
jgi:hypothetical protein